MRPTVIQYFFLTTQPYPCLKVIIKYFDNRRIFENGNVKQEIRQFKGKFIGYH